MTLSRRAPQFPSSAVVTLPALAAAQVRLSEPLPYSPDSWFEMARQEFCNEGDTHGDAPERDAAFSGNA